MAIESPLFQSSMELLGHSIHHFNNSGELDRKLVIIHLSNAIELILKDIVLDSGESIYKNPKETISIHSCISTLKDKKITIPYLNKIELLIDERNALQHRFGSPNELTTIFYMNIVIDFFKIILPEHYDQEYEEIINQFANAKDLVAFQLREPTGEDELDNLRQLSKLHPLGALLSATAYLEKIIISFTESLNLNNFTLKGYYIGGLSHRALLRYGIVPPEDLQKKMDETRQIRNLAAHGRKDPSQSDVEKTIDAVENYEKFLNNLNKQEVVEMITKISASEEALKTMTSSRASSILKSLDTLERAVGNPKSC